MSMNEHPQALALRERYAAQAEPTMQGLFLVARIFRGHRSDSYDCGPR